jgi:UDP-sulfoquinovose synthase
VKVLVAGGDGFIGWPLSIALGFAGYDVLIVDNFSRRSLVKKVGSDSLVPILELQDRLRLWNEVTRESGAISMEELDLADNASALQRVVSRFVPDVFVHLATMPSAPYSMKNGETGEFTIANNVRATFNVLTAVANQAPEAHVVHIGTMGVYGYDVENYSIPEGYLRVKVQTASGEEKELSVLHPMQPGSLYHLTKAQDQLFFEFFNRQRKISITDLHQGIVWGVDTELTRLDEGLATRVDYDSDFGTVLNRFAVQTAVGHPITVYGSGTQKRAFIHLRDSIRCLMLAIERPPGRGDRVRIFNQFTQIFSVQEIAAMVSSIRDTTLGPLENPRLEKEHNSLSAINEGLLNLGLRPTMLDRDLIREIVEIAYRYQARVNPEVIKPMSFWQRSPSGSQKS